MKSTNTSNELKNCKFEIENLHKEVSRLNQQLNNDAHKKSINKFYNFIKSYSNIVIDIFITLFFVFGIFATSLFAIYNTGKSILKSIIYNQNNLLSIVEHFFLYIIPVFIFIGFYVYYILKYQVIIYHNENLDPEKLKLANTSISITKTLFLSSIMSYTIIKIIEIIFPVSKHREELSNIVSFSHINNTQLITYGIFLLILMTYLLISHKGDK